MATERERRISKRLIEMHDHRRRTLAIGWPEILKEQEHQVVSEARAVLTEPTAPPVAGWLPIETAPKESNAMFVVRAEDGRMLVVSRALLAVMMRADTPGHLAFRAVLWAPLPPAPEAQESEAGS